MVRLGPASLHGSLEQPESGAISFLNEVMARHPHAISFAPGAPHPDLLEGIAPGRYIDRFLEHLTREAGCTAREAQLQLLEYGPSRGLINGLIAEALRRDFGIETHQDAVVVTVGAQEAMFLTLRALYPVRGDLLAIAEPCFVGITGAARLLDIEPLGIPETSQGIDLDALSAACARTRGAGRRVRACYIAPDFANPGGSQMSMSDRERLLEIAEQEDFLILEDNAYAFTAAAGAELPPLKTLDIRARVVHIGTFAKICFPGARVGYVVADQRVGRRGEAQGTLADALAAIKSMVTVNTSPLSQAVIGGMLLEHDCSLVELSRRKAALYQRNLSLLSDALDRHLTRDIPSGISWNRPQGGFFVRMSLPVPADSALLNISAARYGVLWTPMASFHLSGAGACELRLSCSYLTPQEIETGVGRLADLLREEVPARMRAQHRKHGVGDPLER
ncbi:PLP-dependent aminotransferase family protein [Streptomyces uncialis]|uniref:aminotransferase-like domain-containing protein n=1 Tax=Streptomyces uncialis TaxID=1048205 RepID=UPI003660B95A